MKVSGQSRKTRNSEPLEFFARNTDDKTFSYAALNQVSRSFALVIQQLPTELKDAVCLFYLILRGLDTIEDDMNLTVSRKQHLLSNFHEYIFDPEWSLEDVGDTNDYQTLLRHFDKIIRFFLNIDPKYQEVISDIARRMAYGMANHGESKVETLEDYDQYCHYVAGLVGHGLSALFSASGLEDEELKDQLEIANSMGLFLQKTNIIRDYHEDLQVGRLFWPREVWLRYADNIEDFEKNPNSESSLACLNHMVADALRHVEDCLDYMEKLHNPQVFRFCAIPQVMAIGTLAEVYNNPKTFSSVVKIRKGMTARLIRKTKDPKALRKVFCRFATKM
jgi:farnesyl-diphosphate farnesyltransferase